MDVIIVSKTHMSSAACVGGVLTNGRFVRLLDSNGYNQDSDTKLEVGDVYTITFSERQNKRPPHVEDILVISMTYKSSFQSSNKMIEYLTEELKIKIWKGSPEILFDGKLQWTASGSGYISEIGGIPENSVGFWMPDKELIGIEYDKKVKYRYPIGLRNIKFVGFQNPIDTIQIGTLVRVSLARWWVPSNEDEKRCYLQLSGWFTETLDDKILFYQNEISRIPKSIDEKNNFQVLEARKKFSRQYEPWSEYEVQILKNLVNFDLTVKQISKILKRGSGAIRSRMKKHELKSTLEIKSGKKFDENHSFQDSVTIEENFELNSNIKVVSSEEEFNQIKNSFSEDSVTCLYCNHSYPYERKKLGYNYCVDCSTEKAKRYIDKGFQTRAGHMMMNSNKYKNSRDERLE